MKHPCTAVVRLLKMKKEKFSLSNNTQIHIPHAMIIVILIIYINIFSFVFFINKILFDLRSRNR